MAFPIVNTGLPLISTVADDFIVSVDELVTPGSFYIIASNTTDLTLKPYVQQVLEFTGTQLNYYYLEDGQEIDVGGELYNYSPANGWIKTDAYNSGSPDLITGGGITELQVQNAVENALTASEPISVNTGSAGGTLVSSATGTATGTAFNVVPPAGAVCSEIQNKSVTDFLYVKFDGTATLTDSFTLIPLESKKVSGILAESTISVITDGASVDYYVEFVN